MAMVFTLLGGELAEPCPAASSLAMTREGGLEALLGVFRIGGRGRKSRNASIEIKFGGRDGGTGSSGGRSRH